MPRVKRGVTARARHKKILALAKGYRGTCGACSSFFHITPVTRLRRGIFTNSNAFGA